MNGSSESTFPMSVWLPRILMGVSILLLIYFTQTTHRFRGTYDETFLDPANLALTRGPWAYEEYYRFGELDYAGRDPFANEVLPTAPGESALQIPAEFEFEDLNPTLFNK